MLIFEDPRWKTLDGTYGMHYDPRPLLNKLPKAESIEEQKAIFSEWWNDLYHDGNVGLASYATIPKLVRIGIETPILCPDFFTLISLVEISRHDSQNPDLPDFLEEEYNTAMKWVAMISLSA